MGGGFPVTTTQNVAAVPTVTVWFVGCVVIVGAKFTVNVALLLVTLPALFVTTTTYKAPLSAEVVAGVVKLDAVAPDMFVPFFCHWKAGAGVPVATTLKVAVAPAVTVLFAGWVVMAGGTWLKAQLTAALKRVVPVAFVTALWFRKNPTRRAGALMPTMVAPEGYPKMTRFVASVVRAATF